jgi:CBS domain-containing membrane protein
MTASRALVSARRLAEAVRDSCVAAALDGYEHAALCGLCHEGAFEAAIGAVRAIDLAALAERSDGDVGPHAEPSAIRVRDVMAFEVVTLRPSDPLLIADDVMRLGRIRHLPVVDEAGRLQGVLTQRDLLRAALSLSEEHDLATRRGQLKTLMVSEAMTRDVVVTSPDTWLREAAAEMFHRKLGCLPVVQDGELVGIVTEADFIRLAF